MRDLRLELMLPQPATQPVVRVPFGRHLVNEGLIDQRDLVHALEMQCHIDAPLGEIMVAEGLLNDAQMHQALARQFSAQCIDLLSDPPEMALAGSVPATLCLQHQVVPWLRLGDLLLVATSRPDRFDKFRACMGAKGRYYLPVVAPDVQIKHQIGRLYGGELAKRAATRVPAIESCRTWENASRMRPVWASLAVGAGLCALLLSPMWTVTVLMLVAVLTLVMTTTMKFAAFFSQLTHNTPERADKSVLAHARFRLPRVSVLVPLLKEKEIAGKLIERLGRLTYPKSLLNVILVLEEGDTVTRETIDRTEMPPWMSVIEVPQAGNLTTKPRALNYALDFCQGSIIGVWDAEDAPEPDQIERIVNRFNAAPANVACLQGMLDYYNPRQNWLARCFTIEYATWWRMVIPGIARLGLIVPLGGTTLFFRRDILEKLCGWDAHNVTEDADLGVRLARHGYKTELVPTVTYEEANCRAWPWVRQRSRWLKGFMITWCVHMRQPVKLFKEVGFKRFLGLQTIFLATVAQFACAPLLWSFWLIPLGVPHPLGITLGVPFMWGVMIFFVVAELINMSISLVAVSGKEHRHLMAFVPTTLFYYPLGMLAAYKALYEVAMKPFYWDKTQHGVGD